MGALGGRGGKGGDGGGLGGDIGRAGLVGGEGGLMGGRGGRGAGLGGLGGGAGGLGRGLGGLGGGRGLGGLGGLGGRMAHLNSGVPGRGTVMFHRLRGMHSHERVHTPHVHCKDSSMHSAITAKVNRPASLKTHHSLSWSPMPHPAMPEPWAGLGRGGWQLAARPPSVTVSGMPYG